MISVTRLNGQQFVLNADLIRTIEENPDTIVTLISGEHLVVREPSKEIVRRVIEYNRHLRRLSTPA
ncbi:MAG: flagellar FlbD family protein [Phycisphaerales bacterium JB052]|nr:flagellar protein FlbD [Phycisphaerae bacterium]MBM92478.1 flagellar protein FlbD [Phycisphaerae bacterium]HCT45494.1 flagellar protein FlbD [Phycisphaerales bacterium]|tara:strand:- start:804 stop:1001 length:198 start_codon:yes stop_codon:yes gene_type:complete